VIRGHPELKYFVGMDVDPVASDVAQSRINSVLDDRESSMKVFTVLRNFRHIKSVLRGTGEEHLGLSSVDGILMDLGMSSMQVHFQHYIGYIDLLS
jgi:16S rRNA (cytosine1402-N4)-methyltransferase